jgi:hypothetical protein
MSTLTVYDCLVMKERLACIALCIISYIVSPTNQQTERTEGNEAGGFYIVDSNTLTSCILLSLMDLST